MIDIAPTTAFRLVVRLVLGQAAKATYLLIYEEQSQSGVEADLQAEVQVQLGTQLYIREVSEVVAQNAAPLSHDSGAINVFRITNWFSELPTLLDTHINRLECAGNQILFLTTAAIAERLLIHAPNIRNRLTDVLQIVPEDLSVGAAAVELAR